MGSVYESKLISKLYNLKFEKIGIYSYRDESFISELDDILNSIVETKNEIFIQPIIDAFYKFKNESFSHYFLSALLHSSFYSNLLVINLAKKNILESDGINPNFEYSVSILYKARVYEKNIIDKIFEFLSIPKNFNKIDEFDVEEYLSYIFYNKDDEDLNIKANFLFSYYLFNTSDINIAHKKYILKFFMNNKYKILKEYIFSEYETVIKNQKIEEIIVKEAISQNLLEIISFIKINGGQISLELVEKYEENKKENDKKNKEKQVVKDKIKYSKIDLVDEIIQNRDEINNIFSISFGFKVMLPSENIIKQSKRIDSKEFLESYCGDLRAIISDIDVDSLKNNLSDKEIGLVLPGINQTDYNKPINKLFIFLCEKNKGKKLNMDFFGIRSLNKLISLLFAHKDESKELLKMLEKLKLKEYYGNKDWEKIHINILEMYNLFLINFLSFLKK